MSDDNSESELYDNFRLTIQEKSINKNVSGMILNLWTSLFYIGFEFYQLYWPIFLRVTLIGVTSLVMVPQLNSWNFVWFVSLNHVGKLMNFRILFPYHQVGDGCPTRNVMMTILRCWWRVYFQFFIKIIICSSTLTFGDLFLFFTLGL